MDRHSRIVLIIVGVVTIALVAVAVVVAIQPPEQYDPTTPEGAVQGFYQAVLDGDRELATSYLALDLITDCRKPRTELYGPERFRVVIVDTETAGDNAKADVTITETWNEGPFSDSHTFNETLHLTRGGDVRLILASLSRGPTSRRLTLVPTAGVEPATTRV